LVFDTVATPLHSLFTGRGRATLVRTRGRYTVTAATASTVLTLQLHALNQLSSASAQKLMAVAGAHEAWRDHVSPLWYSDEEVANRDISYGLARRDRK
jgi:hypothetical protein